jgi:hypothetical protein
LQSALQLTQLVVDVNPKRLKGPGRGVDAPGGGAPHDGAHDGRKVARPLDGPVLSRRDDGPRHLPGFPFFAETEQYLGELRLAHGHDDLRGARRARVLVSLAHAHVERPVLAERKAAFGLVELMGRYAQIERNSVDPAGQLMRQQVPHVPEPALDQRKPAAVALDQFLAAFDRRAVPVDAPHPAVGGLQQRAAVAAGTERAVDVDSAVARRQRL